MEEKKPIKKFKLKKFIKYFTLIIFVCIFFIFNLFIFNFINSTTKFIAKNESIQCLAQKYCIEIQAIYTKGWALWKPLDFLPSFFSITTSGFKEGQALKIICPTNLENLEDNIIKKAEYSFGNQNINLCRVEKLN